MTKQTLSSYHVVNPLILVLYLYQYGLVIPFLIKFNSQLPIVVFTLLLVVVLVITKGWRINGKVLVIMFLPCLLILLKTILTPVVYGEDNTFEILLNFFSIGLSGILIGALRFDLSKFFHYGMVVGWINFLFLFMVPLRGVDTVNYMRFGYAMLPTLFFAIYAFFHGEYKYINLFIILLSTAEIVLFGARGATLSILVFVLFVVFVLVEKYKFLRYSIVLLLLALVIFFEKIVLMVASFLDSAGYNSYAITKFLRVVQGEGDFESISSGRFDVYGIAFQLLDRYPILGTPLNSALQYTGLSYYHNIFLDVGVNFGIIIFTGFVLFIVWSVFKMLKCNNVHLKWIYCVLFTLAFVRLFVSSIFWQRPEFWIFISFYVNSELLGLKIGKGRDLNKLKLS